MASEGEPHGQAVERIAFISGYHLTSVWRRRASPMARLSSVLRLYLGTIALLHDVVGRAPWPGCRVYCVYIWVPSHFCMASEGEPHGQAVERIAFISGYHLTSAWRLRASPMARLSSVLRLYLVTISLQYGV